MRFLFQSLFWLAVVGAFMPRDIAAEPDAAPATASTPLFDAGVTVAQACERQPEICAVGVEAGRLAVDVGRVAVSAGQDLIENLPSDTQS